MKYIACFAPMLFGVEAISLLCLAAIVACMLFDFAKAAEKKGVFR